ncbi:hypothetical protein R9X49_07705 [Pectobacterium carotovorum]|uniref:hypothetical protein n=1 Tax=Pectobacterium carotovorum TaxID=554 RepID=UPI0029DC8EAB|nr:hypothetical protein [Pectobacterium carotovorum]MDX6914992.1 hypothetical protein [Pectobacterium carotovorum]
MKYKGIVYDVGLRFTVNHPLSVEPFDPVLVRYDINAIANDMHANAIRIEGEDIERLIVATRLAHASGLTVFFNPWKMNVSVNELVSYFREAARAAEILRKEGVKIIFVCGCEITLFNQGIFSGNTVIERVEWLGALGQNHHTSEAETILAEKLVQLNEVLQDISKAVRNEYGGLLTYAAGSWESVDNSLFDITGVDYYRHGESSEEYVSGLERYRTDKPFVVMEVGCCSYVGAAEKGAGGFMLLEGQHPDGTGSFTGGIVPVRSEQEQANYVGEQLELLHHAGVEGVFIYVFSFPTYRTGEGAKDLDMMSFSLVKTFPENDPRSTQIPPWMPKESFHRIASFYRNN